MVSWSLRGVSGSTRLSYSNLDWDGFGLDVPIILLSSMSSFFFVFFVFVFTKNDAHRYIL